MSDIPPKKPPLLTLLDKIILDIFHLSDPKTLLACRATNDYWNEKLRNIQFLQETHCMWKAKSRSIYLHLSHGPFNPKPDWMMKIDITTGEAAEFQLPVSIKPGGWFRIIGIANGNIYICYSSTGKQAKILIWNPTSNIFRTIRDPMQHFCSICMFIYAFVYRPISSALSIVHIFKKNLGDDHCWLTMYSPKSPDWKYIVRCPTYVRNLDPKNVTFNGVSYWLSWSIYDSRHPSHILAFSVLTKRFFTISIPHYAVSHDHQLMIYQDSLCMVCNRDIEGGFETNVWKISKNGLNYAWDKISHSVV